MLQTSLLSPSDEALPCRQCRKISMLCIYFYSLVNKERERPESGLWTSLLCNDLIWITGRKKCIWRNLHNSYGHLCPVATVLVRKRYDRFAKHLLGCRLDIHWNLVDTHIHSIAKNNVKNQVNTKMYRWNVVAL